MLNSDLTYFYSEQFVTAVLMRYQSRIASNDELPTNISRKKLKLQIAEELKYIIMAV